MKKQKVGLILFLLGALIIFGIGWVAPWFTSPVWSSAPPEHFDGTIWEAFGLIFMAMFFTFLSYYKKVQIKS